MTVLEKAKEDFANKMKEKFEKDFKQIKQVNDEDK
jgi:hypothetical protein